jgi:hypothetical protein
MADIGLPGVRLMMVVVVELDLEEAVADSRSKVKGKVKGKGNVEAAVEIKLRGLQVDAQPFMAVLRLRIARVALLRLLALLLGLPLEVRIKVDIHGARFNNS